MQELAILSELPLLLFVALIAIGIARRLDVNALPIIVIFGLLMGAVLPKSEPGYTEHIQDYVILAIGAVAFLVGSSIPIKQVTKNIAVSIGSSTVLALLLLAAGFLIFPLVGQTELAVLFLGITVSAGSMIAANDILRHHQQSETPMDLMSRLWLVGQYLMLVPVFMVFSELGEANKYPDLVTPVIQSVVLISFSFAIGLYVLPKIKQALKLEEAEGKAILAVGAAVGLILLADILEIPPVVAAFAIGLSVSGQIKISQFTNFLWPILVGLVAVSLGALVDFAQIDYSLLLIILLVVIPLKMIISIAISVWFGSTIMEALGIAISQSQISEIVLVLVLVGTAEGWFESESLAPTILAAIAIGYILSPVIYSNVDWIHALLEKNMRSFTPNLHRGLFINSNGQSIVKQKQSREPKRPVVKNRRPLR